MKGQTRSKRRLASAVQLPLAFVAASGWDLWLLWAVLHFSI
jgi:hypothetical protein